uniref:Protein kinase domain-containing protein n=1 Tax=Quercus lobata TaxID=97700 RepID=A0A7N2MZN6_QUELO
MITNFFSILTPFTSAVSFNFTSFDSPDPNILYEHAYADEDQVIQLTGSKLKGWIDGRATYSRPMHLWDKDSGKLTDFSTHFSFVIDAQNQPDYADGLAFFLAPNGSNFSMAASAGYLGLFNPASEPTDNFFVAVEFDIFTNVWDPPGEHVGIDINSIISVANVPWLSNISIKEGKANEAWISYNSSSKNLSVVFTGFKYNVTVNQSLSYIVDLRKRNRRANKDDRALDEEFKRETGPRRFTYDELARATNDFNNKEKLGQGVFGGVYRGFLRDINSIVAVKRVSEGSTQGIREYAVEVKIISKLRHKNLVQLIGWCHERSRGQLLLVSDFMPNGSLDSHLYKKDTLLVWEVRDIKPSNIMLDSNFNAKLGDFGLARLVDHVSALQTTDLAGTKGYMDLGCVTTQRASKESDIYSFGIVALELACGRKPINHEAPEDQVVMLEWVQELHGRGVLLDAANHRLGGQFDEQQMNCLLIVGLWCAHFEYDHRPSIKEAIQVLNFEAPLPLLQFDIPRTLESYNSTSYVRQTN